MIIEVLHDLTSNGAECINESISTDSYYYKVSSLVVYINTHTKAFTRIVGPRLSESPLSKPSVT